MLIRSLWLVLAPLVPHGGTRPTRPDAFRPKVEVWTDNGNDPYHAGDQARVYLKADQDAYVTVFRVDTDGRVRVLFPRDPWVDNFVRGDREYEIQSSPSSDAFSIDDDPGVGYVFAVASADPFAYEPIESGDHWDYRTIADGQVRGDPYVALTDLAQRIVPGSDADWDYDITPYYVEQHYQYPRFLCYNCHAYSSFRSWDPYASSCVRFRIVMYDDPYYYPYRAYRGTRVVFTRPARPEPRFIFKDRDPSGNDRFVTVERERPLNDDGRRGVTGRDVGGAGSVPPPTGVGLRDRGTPPTAAPVPTPGDRGRREEPRPADQQHPAPRPEPRRGNPPPPPGPRAEPRRPPPKVEHPKPAPNRGQPELRRRKP